MTLAVVLDFFVEMFGRDFGIFHFGAFSVPRPQLRRKSFSSNRAPLSRQPQVAFRGHKSGGNRTQIDLHPDDWMEGC